MDDGIFASLQRFKCFPYNMLPGLCQNLYRHVVRDQVLLNQRPEEFIFRLRSRRKTYFNFFKANLDQEFKKIQLLLQAHGNHQRLIAVSQIHTAPHRSMLH